MGVLAIGMAGQATGTAEKDTAPASRAESPATFVDAALEATPFGENQVWLFKDDEYVRYDVRAEQTLVGPRKIAEGWPGLPSRFTRGINAAVPAPVAENQAWLFRGDEYVRYDLVEERVVSGPRKISEGWPGLPPRFTRSIDSAVTATPFGEDQVWLFKDDEYVRYDVRAEQTLVGPRKISEGWADLPSDFDYRVSAAVTSSYGPDQAWLFNDDEYLRYDTRDDRIIVGPKDTSEGWPGLRWRD
jgi:Hemopexin